MTMFSFNRVGARPNASARNPSTAASDRQPFAVRLASDVLVAAGILALFGLIGLDSAGDRRTDRPERSAVTSQYESRRPAVLRAALGVPYVRGTVLLTGVHVHLRHGGRALPPPEPRADSSVGYSAVGTDSGLSFGHHHHLDGAVPRLDAGRGGRVDFRNLHQSGLEHGVLVHPVPDHEPTELDEAARSLQLTRWQRFWTLDVPNAMIPLLWNCMMSVGGGWFFLTASEMIW